MRKLWWKFTLVIISKKICFFRRQTRRKKNWKVDHFYRWQYISQRNIPSSLTAHGKVNSNQRVLVIAPHYLNHQLLNHSKVTDLFIFHLRKVKILIVGFKVTRVFIHHKHYFSQDCAAYTILKSHQIVANVHIFIYFFFMLHPQFFFVDLILLCWVCWTKKAPKKLPSLSKDNNLLSPSKMATVSKIKLCCFL